MTSVEKEKTMEEPVEEKENKKATESDVLERVMDSIEMAGASLDFFEGDQSSETLEASETEELEEALEAASSEETEEVMEASSEEAEEVTEESGDTEALEAQDQEMEALSDEVTEDEVGEDLSEAETMDMLAEEDDVEFVEHKQALSILESLLFSSDRPLGLGTFKQVFKGTNFKTKDIKKALEELQTEYADLSRGVTLEEINGGWQLRTKVDNMDFLRKLAKARPFKLSGPALEVLAIVAYKQPMVKSEVDEIRGVESGHLVRALMEKGLLSFQGKSELPGKPMQYGTTKKFLEIFGLRNLRELPSLDEIDQLLPDGIGLEEEDEKLSDVTDKMAEEFSGAYSEGQEELEKIEATLGDIDTSSEFFEEEKRRQKEKRDRDRARDIREALDVGEEVDPKDQRWLAKYDEKLAELAALAEAEAEKQEASGAEELDVALADSESEDGMVMEASDAEVSEPVEDETEALEALIAEPEDMSEELSALTEESETLVSEDVMLADEELEQTDEEFEAIEGAEGFEPFSEEE